MLKTVYTLYIRAFHSSVQALTAAMTQTKKLEGGCVVEDDETEHTLEAEGFLETAWMDVQLCSQPNHCDWPYTATSSVVPRLACICMHFSGRDCSERCLGEVNRCAGRSVTSCVLHEACLRLPHAVPKHNN